MPRWLKLAAQNLKIPSAKQILHSSSAPAILKPMQPQSSINLRKRDDDTMLSGTAAETENAPSSLGFPGTENATGRILGKYSKNKSQYILMHRLQMFFVVLVSWKEFLVQSPDHCKVPHWA